jgi:zinc/manganese transport system substrate-binding protein
VHFVFTRLRRPLAIALTLILSLGGLLAGPVSAQDSGKLKVVATFSILGDVVQNVGGDAVDLTTIVGPDGDPHTFEPKPDQISALADAKLIFENGIGFETWLDDMYSSSGSSATRVVVTDGLPLLAFNGQSDVPATPHATGDGHGHDEHDPHVWQDVSNVIAEVGTIRDALIDADPAHADTYTANAAAYTSQLQELDGKIRQMVETLPADKRVLVTSHDSLGYFAHAYGFTIAGTALGSLSTEGADPSAGDIARLIDQIKATGVPAIFAENVESQDLMQQIARDAGVTLAPPLYTDALSKADGPAATYIALMTYNATTIVTALGGKAA